MFKKINCHYIIPLIFFSLFAIAILIFATSCEVKNNKKIDLGDLSNIETDESGNFIVAIDPKSLLLKNENKLDGFDIDVIKLVASDLSLNVKFQTMDYDEIYNSIKNHDVDAGIFSKGINANYQKDIAFSAPYYNNTNSIGILNSNINLFQAVNKDIAIRIYDGSIGQLIEKWYSQE